MFKFVLFAALLFCFVFHLSLSLSEASLPILIAKYRLVQIRFAEVRPVGVTEIKLRVCNLPKQIVGDSQFAPRTYQQVWVRHKICRKILGNSILRNVVSLNFSFSHERRNILHRPCNPHLEE